MSRFTDDPARSPNRLRSIKAWLQVLVFGALLAYFLTWAFPQRDVTVTLNPWLLGSREPLPVPVYVPVALACLLGALAVWAIERVESLRQRLELRRRRQRITSLEAEVTRLRNLPLEEDLAAPPTQETSGSLDD